MFLNDIGRKELRVIRFMTLRRCVFLVGGCIVELSVAGGSLGDRSSEETMSAG